MGSFVMYQHGLVYSRHYCNRPLRWHIVQDPSDPSKAPDVVFDDITFNPLLSKQNTDVPQLLETWESSIVSLAALLELLVEQYVQHQKDKIAALDDERMLFELAMLEDLGCNEVLLTTTADGTQQACFSIPVDVDLAAPARKLIAFLQETSISSSSGTQQQQVGTGQQQQQQQQQFMLHVAFRVGPGVNSHTAPDLQLQSPVWAAQYLPQLPLPSWDPQTSLVEYVPHLAERLGSHLQDHCTPAVIRFELIKALSAAIGQPLEVNMGCSAIRNTPIAGSSSSTGSLAAAAAAKGRGSSSAVFQVLYEQQPLLFFVELTTAFPADAPLLMIQNISTCSFTTAVDRSGVLLSSTIRERNATQRQERLGADSCHTLRHVPWSPRWGTEEMAARLFNFVKQELPSIVRDAASGSTSSVL